MSSVLEEENTLRAEPTVVGEIIGILRQSSRIVIAGHLRPDGDCLGSCLGLLLALSDMGKQVRFYTAGPVQNFFAFLPGFDRIETECPKGQPDVYVCVDSAGLDRIHDDFKPSGLVVNIDHHLSNTEYGDVNWVDTEAAAAGEQIYRLLTAMNQPITPAIATCLYTAILTDTGGFRYSNTDQETFQAAAHLVQIGADPAGISEAVFENRKPEAVYMTGKVYTNIRREFEGKFVWSELDQQVFDEAGGGRSEPEGLSSDLRAIQGVEVAVLFVETPEHHCRIGFRSKGRINVSELAEKLGGGGHHNASGAYVKEPYAQTKERALGVIRDYLREKLG